jgi:hypothetical protein
MNPTDGQPPTGFDTTGNEPVRRRDGYDIGFNDVREFCSGQWVDIVTTTTERLGAAGDHVLHRPMTLG